MGMLGSRAGVVVGRRRGSRKGCAVVRGVVVSVGRAVVIVIVIEFESWSWTKMQVCGRGGLRRGCGGLGLGSVWASPRCWSMKVRKVVS